MRISDLLVAEQCVSAKEERKSIQHTKIMKHFLTLWNIVTVKINQRIFFYIKEKKEGGEGRDDDNEVSRGMVK